MTYKLPMKNADKYAVVDAHVFEYLTNNKYLQKLDFIKNLRLHSSGYAFFQKNWKQPDNTYKCETIYLHKLVAEQFIEKPQSKEKLFCLIKDGNNLNCVLDNLTWAVRSHVVRNTKKVENKIGYRGVTKYKNKYAAIIYNQKERITIGLFDTAEQAAEAYNKKSLEIFGNTRSVNKIKTPEEIAAQKELEKNGIVFQGRKRRTKAQIAIDKKAEEKAAKKALELKLKKMEEDALKPKRGRGRPRKVIA